MFGFQIVILDSDYALLAYVSFYRTMYIYRLARRGVVNACFSCVFCMTHMVVISTRYLLGIYVAD